MTRLCLILVVIGLIGVVPPASAVSTHEVGEEMFESLLGEAVTLMVEHHPLLISQRSVVDVSTEISLPRRRFPVSISFSSDVGTAYKDGGIQVVPSAGIGLSIPLTDPDRFVEDLKTEFGWARLRESDRQDLQTMTEQLTSRLIGEIEGMILLKQTYRGRDGLLDILKRRRLEQTELVQAGVERADTIWALDERIADLKVELMGLQTQTLLTVNEIAYNFGGAAWQELKQLLESMLQVSEDMNSDG